MLPYFTVNTVIELLSFLVALIALNKDPNPYWRLLIVYLFLITLGEMIGIHFRISYLKNPRVNISNAWVYNILTIIEILAFNLFFKYIIFNGKKIAKIIIPVIILLFLVLSLIHI